ncbi:CU044_2847 family protein [Nonomuraea sp. NPDC049400]|uniref:CU044_2847 family protein n=1 Tax=Nonomuraea sp. NPDC049400 TaxID=3364352 RepID=UPI0037982C3B
MSELLRWELEEGSVVVEVADEDAGGFQSASVSPDGIVYEVKDRFEDALQNVRTAAASALRTFRDKALNPDEVEIEFGVKFNAAAGAIIAKTAGEAHLKVKLTWSRG